MNQFELGQKHAQEFEDAQAEFFARREDSKCSCRYAIYGINAGTDYFQIETRLERFDPFCEEHGEPNCICHWTISWGDWYIEEYDEDCPIHKHEEIEEEVFPAINWDEIPDRVKENIFSKHGDICVDDEWWEFVYGRAQTIGLKISEFDIDSGKIHGRLMYDAFITKKLILKHYPKNSDVYQTVSRYDLRRKDFSEQNFEYDLLQDYLSMLRKEYEYLTSETTVIETFQANEYVFDKWGRIVR